MERELETVIAGLPPEGATFDELAAEADRNAVSPATLLRWWQEVAATGRVDRAEGRGPLRYRLTA